MTIAVLAKVVPDLEDLHIDPETRTLRREKGSLFVNPFDFRVTVAALALRRPREQVVLVSMGPPEAETPLRELLALGADELLLLSDPALAGSDTLVTAQALASVLRERDFDLVLAGRSSVDSSTGQVPAQLAEILHLPMVDGARSLRWHDGQGLEVAGESPRGLTRYRVPLPCLISAGEKVAKVRHPSPEEQRVAGLRGVSRLGLSDISMEIAAVGLQGSLTVVTGLTDEEPTRSPVVLDEGSLADRARTAVHLATRGWERGPAHRPSLPPEPQAREASQEILVFVSEASGGLCEETLPLLSEVRRLGAGHWASAVGFGPASQADLRRLSGAGASSVHWAPRLTGPVSPPSVLPLLGSLLSRHPHSASMLFLSSPWSRELAGRTSARVGLGLVGDAVGFRASDGRRLEFHKPSFGGGLVATVVCRHPPALATLRPGALEPGLIEGEPRKIEWTEHEVPPTRSAIEVLGHSEEVSPRVGDLDRARIVFGVGMGIGGPDNVRRVEEAARRVGGALGATRKVVDAGWVPPQLQVGLTGKFIAPDLYVAIGLSGKTNHFVGVKRAGKIIGINSDRGAPLFTHVDVGLVGNWEDLLDPLVQALELRVAGRVA